MVCYFRVLTFVYTTDLLSTYRCLIVLFWHPFSIICIPVDRTIQSTVHCTSLCCTVVLSMQSFMSECKILQWLINLSNIQMHYKCLIYRYTSSIWDYCHMTVKIAELSFLGLSDIEDLCQIRMAGIVAPTLPCIPMSGFVILVMELDQTGPVHCYSDILIDWLHIYLWSLPYHTLSLYDNIMFFLLTLVWYSVVVNSAAWMPHTFRVFCVFLHFTVTVSMGDCSLLCKCE
jgi:hypothetical protein